MPTIFRSTRSSRSAARASCIALACASLLAGTAAQAANVSGVLSFTASGFPGAAPHDPVTGTVAFSFDNSANFIGAADGSIQNGAPVTVSVAGLSLPGGWTPVITYLASGLLPGGIAVQDLMSIGHALNGSNVIAGTDDWRVAFNTISTAPGFREFTYASATEPAMLFQTFQGSVTAVPEPANWALLGLGLAGISVARRRFR